ncbi:preprotein translocase subunit YajC [Fodinicurvata sp. EGI_FJ10296]|uniref:preprotein translocase subunit YajC n=1 Tax=Fodinicurvata sp. EGI_FJ10296 TaxID=3231908 RepID=UPI0034527E40
MFISQAYAQSGGAGGGNLLINLLPLILIFVVFYFLLIRPQQKRQKQHREMLDGIRRGDRIVTNGGIVGQVVKVGSDNMLTLEIADGVRVKAMQHMVADVLAKTKPARGKGGDDQDGESDAADGDTAAEPPAADAKKGFGRFLGR